MYNTRRMKRDTQIKLSKKQYRDKKRDELNKKKKKNEESDSDSNDSDSENEEMDVQEYRKFLSKIFPSKHLAKKIKAGEKVEEKEKKVSAKKSSSKKVSKKKSSKKIEVSDEEESEYDDEEDSDYDDEDDDEEESEDEDEDEESEEEEEEKEIKLKNGNKVNIIFTIGGKSEEEEDEDEDDDYDFEDYEETEEDTEDEDEEVSSDEDTEYEKEDQEEAEEEEKSKKKVKKVSKENVKKENIKEEKKENIKEENKKQEAKKEQEEDKPNQKTTEEILIDLKELYAKNPRDKSIKKCIDVYELEISKDKKHKDKKEQKQKDKNLRIFRKIIKDKNTMNDFACYEKLELVKQKHLIKELREINKLVRIEKPYRMTLLESSIPVEFKSAAMKKINSLKHMDPGSGDFYKIKNWVDTFMHIPFTEFNELPISIEDGVEKCHDFMENAQKTLDSAVYGLNDAKMQIMQMLGQLLTNPKAIGTAIAIHGPPGTGKTSLVKEGISKILNRPFAFIALGGATDSSFLEGHSYTYEGSTWGKIVQILIDSKCMNPVIYFDELDKISDTPRGEEIAGILTHLSLIHISEPTRPY